MQMRYDPVLDCLDLVCLICGHYWSMETAEKATKDESPATDELREDRPASS
jgi:hypothetical protein